MHAYLILLLLLSSNSILISFHNGSTGYSAIVMPVFLYSPTYAGNCQFRKLSAIKYGKIAKIAESIDSYG